MKTEPQKEHEWLQKLVGEWTYEMEDPGKPGEPAAKVTGTESVRSIGGLWVLAEGRGEMPDGTSATNLMTLGYDPDRKRYIGTWVGSMMTHLWLYEGELNPEQTALRLSSEGPAMAGDGTTAKYEDMVVFKSNDHRLLTARVQGPDGQWEHLMTVEYRRV